MVRLSLTFVLLLWGWAFFTQSGKAFYKEHFSSKQEVEADVKRRTAMSHIERQIREKEVSIRALTREMQFELMIRSRRSSTPLRTDPIFLERSIKRLEEDKKLLESKLAQVR